MATVPRFYSSTDAGAPQLSGQVGSLLVVLDAVLVDGYGVGEAFKPGAGWTRHLTAAGKRAYRNDPYAGSGFVLEVDDSASAGTARYARARGYSALRSFGDGDDATPSPGARPAGSIIAKSSSLSATASRWVAIADSRCIYLFTNVNPALLVDQRQAYFFGDFTSYKPGDTMAWCISHSGLVDYLGTEDFDGFVFSTQNEATSIDVNRPACYLPRTVNSPVQSAPAFLVGGMRYTSFHAWNSDGARQSTYPDAVTGGLLYTGVQIFEGSGRPRGVLPGIAVPYHLRPFVDLSVQAAPFEFRGASQIVAVGYAPNYYSSALNGDPYRGQLLFSLGGGWW